MLALLHGMPLQWILEHAAECELQCKYWNMWNPSHLASSSLWKRSVAGTKLCKTNHASWGAEIRSSQQPDLPYRVHAILNQLYCRSPHTVHLPVTLKAALHLLLGHPTSSPFHTDDKILRFLVFPTRAMCAPSWNLLDTITIILFVSNVSIYLENSEERRL